MNVALLAPVTLKVKENLVGLIGSTTTWLAVLAGDLQRVESWLRIASYGGALLVSAFTIWSLVRKDRRETKAASK